MFSIDLDALFLFVLNQSIVASYVIVGVLVLRLFLKPAPKIFSYVLWGVVLFRLICPLSFESTASVIPVSAQPITQTQSLPADTQDAAQEDTATQENMAASEDVILQNETNAQTTANMGTVADDSAASGALVSGATASDANAGASANPLQIWFFAARWVWLFGIVGLLLYSLTSLVRLLYELSNAIPLAKEALPVGAMRDNACPCEIYYSSKVETAFVLGVLHPKIYLPVHLSRSEMQYILQHEQTHIRRGDHIIKLIAFFVLCVHWFNPLVWVAFFLAGKDMELSCDESVLNALGYGIKKEYSASLLSLATGKRILGGTPLAFGEGDTKSRIKNVLRYQSPARWCSVVVGCALLCAGVLLLTTRTVETEGEAGAASEVLSTTQQQQETEALQTISVQIDNALPDETSALVRALAQNVVQGAVDTLDAAGGAPADGSNGYFVREAVITGLVSQNTGAATKCFAVGTYLLEYQITLSTTEGITLPEGFQLATSAQASGTVTDASAVTVCTPTTGAQPYLYIFGGAYSGAAEWQVLGVMPYDEIDRQYGGPAMVANYGDCITASGIKLLNACLADEVDFEQFTFAAPDGLLVDVSTPTNSALVWYADINHSYRDEAIWIVYDTFVTREYTGVSVFWQRSYEDYAHTVLDVTLGEGDNTTKPTLYAIYTDAAGEEYLFAYASSSGSEASLDGTDYYYALYALTDDGADGEIYAVDAGSYCFAPDQTVSAQGISLQTALDTINAYAKDSAILISIEQAVQYYTADGRKVSVELSQAHPAYFYSIGSIDTGMTEYTPDMYYYALSDGIESASVSLTALEEPLYMQITAE